MKRPELCRIIGRSIPIISALVSATVAQAQIQAAPNWPNEPSGPYRRTAYPYPGQCYSDPRHPIAGLPQCTLDNAKSFQCAAGHISNQTAGDWGACGSVSPPPTASAPLRLLTGDTQRANKYQHPLLNPLDYVPDTTRFPGADYYEIGVHEAWGFQGIADVGLFPNPTIPPYNATPVPDGKQWTGITVPGTTTPLFTPIWGVGQINDGGGPITTTLQGAGLFKPGTASPWSANDYVATWPSISIRGQTGRPVVVKWLNEFPNNHLFCPHPEAADWPCAIDRTFMGVSARIDPQKAPPTFQAASVPYDGVNQYGSPQQPDNSWVTHLHGGEIPPQTDGFPEKWFGNAVTGAVYSPTAWLLNPAFNAPQGALTNQSIAGQYGAIFRPGGDPRGNSVESWMYDTYAYPMVNHESTIWFHDHTLGKTHHNVIAGPAGFFPVKDPSRHGPFDASGRCSSGPGACDYTWLDPVTEPRNSLGIPLYDLFLAIQDRDFNQDGTLNFPNGMASVVGASGYPVVNGNTPVTPGPNPQVHPTWVPEYFASNALVNGVIWPKAVVAPGFYRIRIANGSDARCYNLGFSTKEPRITSCRDPATGLSYDCLDPRSRPTGSDFMPITVIADEQGYLKAPVAATQVLACPGERYELLVDFRQVGRGARVYMQNDAPAPYPGGGNGPYDALSPYVDMATIMRFDVGTPTDPITNAVIQPVTSLVIPRVLDSQFEDLGGNNGGQLLPFCNKELSRNGGKCIAAVRNLYLNERVDGTTGASLGLQINGVPFEYDVTETPKQGTYEMWNVINLTVDAHPIHPHLIRAQIVKRQDFDVAGYKLALCQSFTAATSAYPPPAGTSWADSFAGNDNNCQPGIAPGGDMQLTPDPTPFLKGTPVAPAATESGWKDVMRAMPGQVLTFIAKWDGGWKGASGGTVTAPGAGNAGCITGRGTCVSTTNASQWIFPAVTSGPYVWHCHINSHEDSEMMRSSLVMR